MKRLYKVSFDIVISSVTPILLWFCLSLIADKNLINVFSATYPLQFISGAIISIFSVGANISKERDRNEYAVIKGMLVGISLAGIIFSLFIININYYLTFMSMDIHTYKTFAIFSIVILFLYLVLTFLQNKLYYENNNNLANRYTFIFNSIYAIVLISTAMLTENKIVIVISTLLCLLIYIAFISFKTITPQFKEIRINKTKLSITNLIKYDAVDLVSYISRFLLYLFGFSNSFHYGQEYITALTFCTLLTDTQWDAILSISTVAKIDIAKNKFIYKEHVKNAYKLLSLLFLSIAAMFICLNGYYVLNYKIVYTILLLDLINFVLFPIYAIKMYVIQLTKSAQTATLNKFISYMVRLTCSFLPTPFCTCIGQFVTGIYQFVTFHIIYKYKYKHNK